MIQKVYQDRDWLWKHYIKQEESSSVMAKEVSCSEMTIRNWLHKMGISIRSSGEGSFIARKNSVIITPDLLEFMGGEIQGDGHIRMVSNRSALYSHGSKYEKYLIWLSGRFDAWGIKQSGQITKHINKKNGAIYYNYTSRSYPELIPIRKRWYSEGRKIVPRDLELTPIMARQWYLGDGGFSDYKIKRPGIVFGTYDFDRQSIEHLIEELGKHGFKTTHQPSHNTIRIWARSVQDFLSWIGPCPISCYDYKWAYSKGGVK